MAVFTFLIPLDLSAQRVVVGMQLTLVFLIRTHLIDREFLDRIRQVIAGNEKPQKFIRGRPFRYQETLVLGCLLEGRGVDADEPASLHLKVELGFTGWMAGLKHRRSRCVIENQHGARVCSTYSDFHRKEEESRVTVAHLTPGSEENGLTPSILSKFHKKLEEN